MARITVIDDRPEFLDVMREILEQSGHEPTCLEGPDIDLVAVLATHPELLIVDLRLGEPGGGGSTGWEIVELARASRSLQDTPVIVCSADRDAVESHRREIRAMAGVHVLAKPFSVIDAEELVARALERSTRAAGTPDAAAGSKAREGYAD